MTKYQGAYSQRNRYGNAAVNQSTIYSIRAVANNTSMGRVSVSGDKVATASAARKVTGFTGQTATLQGYAPGTPIHIAATPNPGYRFARWNGLPASANWQSVVTHSVLSFNAQCNLDITAVFEADPEYRPSSTTVTVTARPDNPEMGSVNPTEKTIEKGNEITLTATHKAGYRFVRWEGVGTLAGNAQSNASATIRIRPQADVNAVAVFAKDDSLDPGDQGNADDPGDSDNPFTPETPPAGDPATSQPGGLASVIRKYWWAIAAAVALWYLKKEGKL